MKAYEDFNPNIPDLSDPTEPLETATEPDLPQAPELKKVAEPKKNRRPENKVRPQRQTAPKKKIIKEKKPSRPIGEVIREWSQSQTTRWITGLCLGFLCVYLGVSFLSYFSSCVADQSEINNAPYGEATAIVNEGGEGGARLSEFLINEGFGVASFVIVFWLCAMSLKLLTGRPRFKSVNFTIKSIVALITVSLIVGLLTLGMKSPVNWGGYHGRYVNEQVIHWLGWSGAGILCVFFVSLLIVLCLRDVINWLIGLHRKRQERKRAEAEIEAERRAHEEAIERMRRNEEKENMTESAIEDEEDVKTEEEIAQTEDLSFEEEELGIYSTLSDFDELDLSPREIKEEINHETPVTEENENDIAERIAGPEEDEGDIDERIAGPEENNSEEASNVRAEESSDSGEDPMVVNVNTISLVKEPRTLTEGAMPGVHPYKFPPSELLREGIERVSVDVQEQMANKERIQKTLLDFGIPIQSIEATVGPTVTLYEIVPERGVKINSIRNLVDDIALSLAAVGVRIIAPIPGKGTVGIEVANNDPQTVSMRTIIQSKAFQESKALLPIAMGSTISNEVYITDLAKMPHLLVAGATGQGKSVGLNAIIASLLYSKSPDELKFVMIDPKMVEFSLYAKIESHYLAKIPDSDEAIITDMEKVKATLSSLCVEMDDRYQLLKAAHNRNIVEYNAKIKEGKLSPLEGHRFLPYIVVVVDEFSDLIMTAGKEVETPIARLAQKARAVGMHVIIATQRPSTNVITGIIKANFPARIAFKVSSGVDSKTILDTTGAQQLIGRGDMLISNNAPMVRVQCAFIDTPEVEAICDYINRQPYGQGAYKLPDPVVAGSSDNDGEMGNNFGDKDPLFDEVARLIVTCSTASTSSLQRRYSIGYNRAGKIMDQLEAAGIVGPSQGGKPRSVLIDAVSLEAILHPERE